ncbi:MAG: DUF3108 domain-containing protein [Pseudomonadota bacterium]
MKKLLISASIAHGLACTAVEASEWVVNDFTATYGAKVGIARGETRLELRHVEGNEYVVESWTELRGVISWFKRGRIYEVARFDFVDGALRTRSFKREDDISREDRNVQVDYDWDSGAATVTYQGEASTLPIEDGVSNTLVMQVALMQALSTGERPPRLDVVGHKGRLRFDISYDGDDTTEIDGQARTLFRYSHSRADSGIRTTFWAEPASAHLPLRARIDEDEKVRGQLTLLERDEPARARSSD